MRDHTGRFAPARVGAWAPEVDDAARSGRRTSWLVSRSPSRGPRRGGSRRLAGRPPGRGNVQDSSRPQRNRHSPGHSPDGHCASGNLCGSGLCSPRRGSVRGSSVAAGPVHELRVMPRITGASGAVCLEQRTVTLQAYRRAGLAQTTPEYPVCCDANRCPPEPSEMPMSGSRRSSRTLLRLAARPDARAS